MNLQRDAVWAYNCPNATDLDSAREAGNEVKLNVMWLSKWLKGGDRLEDVLNRCVPMHGKVLSLRQLMGGDKPEHEVTYLVTRDTPHGSRRRECAQMTDPGLLELVAGTKLVFRHYDEDRTAQVTQIIPRSGVSAEELAMLETKTEVTSGDDAAEAGENSAQ